MLKSKIASNQWTAATKTYNKELINVSSSTTSLGNSTIVKNIYFDITSTDPADRKLYLNAVGASGEVTVKEVDVIGTASTVASFTAEVMLGKGSIVCNKLQMAIDNLATDKTITVKSIINYGNE